MKPTQALAFEVGERSGHSHQQRCMASQRSCIAEQFGGVRGPKDTFFASFFCSIGDARRPQVNVAFFGALPCAYGTELAGPRLTLAYMSKLTRLTI